MAFKLKDEHVCSLNSNVQVIGMRDKQDKGGKKFKALFGFAKRGNTSVEVEFRYPKDEWTAKESRAHCTRHNGSFEVGLIKIASLKLVKAIKVLRSKSDK